MTAFWCKHGHGKIPTNCLADHDCPGAYNLHDDLRVVGANDEEHDGNLERVMRKLEESGPTMINMKLVLAA